jgi:hypothetical protein
MGYVKFTLVKRMAPVAVTSGSFKPPMLRGGRSIMRKRMPAAADALAAAERGPAMLPMDMTIIMTDIKTLKRRQQKFWRNFSMATHTMSVPMLLIS